MLDPLDYYNRPLLKMLSQKRNLTALVVFIENLSASSWRIFFAILFFFGLWMLNIPTFFGHVFEILTALGFFGTILYLCSHDLKKRLWPNQNEVDRRLEQTSILPRGQIQALEATLSNPKKHLTRDLWTSFQNQILQSFSYLKNPKPKPILTRLDPNGLRLMAVLIFIVGLWVAGPDSGQRIKNGLIPISAPRFAGEPSKNVHLWVTPPAYTGLGQIYVKGYGTLKDPLNIPEGSTLKVRIQSRFGSFFTPYLSNGTREEKLLPLENNIYGIETEIQKGDMLSLSQFGISRARWPVHFIEDQPPEIKLIQDKETKEPTTVPEILENGQIRFPLEVKDDYGVTDLKLTMQLDEMVSDKPLGENYTDTRLVMSPAGKEFQFYPQYDLSWHTWAGLPVVFELEVFDSKKQSTKLAPIKMILPERSFKEPVAKSLISARKKLAWSPSHDLEKQGRDIETLLSAPSYFKDDMVVFMAIRSASIRLMFAQDLPRASQLEAVQSAISLLWSTAISVEDGALTMALNNLKEAQKLLEEALRNPNTPQEEINKRMDALKQAMAEYFAQLQTEIQKRIAQGEQFPQLPENMPSIDPNTMSSFLDELENQMRSGNKEAAQDMLSKLQRMMEMMDGGAGTSAMPPDMQQMNKGISELQQLIEKQEELKSQTEKQARIQEAIKNRNGMGTSLYDLPNAQKLIEQLKEMGIASPPPPTKNIEPQKNDSENQLSTQSNKAEQEALRKILGQLMMETAEALNDVPEGMSNAEQDMRISEEALGQNTPEASIPHQESAIKNLKEGQENLQKQLSERMQQMIGISPNGGMAGRDPLGRPYRGKNQNGQNQDSDVKIPSEARRKQVEEILKLLRERSGELDRPQEELEYYRRLLKQY